MTAREGKKGTRAGGRGERVERMGEGLFVHASNSLGVISIACSIISPFEEEHCNASSQSEDLKGKGSRSSLHDPAIFDFAIFAQLKFKNRENVSLYLFTYNQ